MTYNGYTNYQTWNIALWIDNDQGLHEQVQEWDDVYALSNWLKDYFTPTRRRMFDRAFDAILLWIDSIETNKG